MSNPYAESALDYLKRGWSPISLPAGSKSEPLKGWTGYHGRYVETPEQVAAHNGGHPGGNVGLRMPETVLGLDVDAYDEKIGHRTLADSELRLGFLPPTYRSSSRDDGRSGILFFRVPAGLTWRDLGKHVEVISWHHRYAVAAPSIHEDTGREYVWADPAGLPCEAPSVEDLLDLPAEWVEELSKGKVKPLGKPEDVVPLAADAARKRIDGAMARLQEAPDGTRNNILNWTAWVVGGLWARVPDAGQPTDLDEDVLRDTLESIARGLGLTGSEVRVTLDSGWGAGVADPMKAAEDRRLAPVLGLRPPVDTSNASEAAEWLLTEVGHAGSPLAGLFQRGNGLVHVPRLGEEGYEPLTDDDEVDGPAQVRDVDKDRLRSEVQFRYSVSRTTKGEQVAALFPVESTKTVLSGLDHAPNLRLLRGITHTPMLRADGSVLDTPGYDPASRRAYLPAYGFTVQTVPDQPPAEDVTAAVALVEQMVAEFPFNTGHDKANYWCLLLTPLLREIAPPPYMMGVINAHMRGSGKSLLAWIVRELHGGVLRGDAPTTGEEFGKQITAILSTTTAPVVQFDNVTKLKATQLDALLTTDVWSDRRLGVSETVTRRNDRLWIATGNNVILGGDLTRRVLWVTIDPSVPNPEKRTDFAILDLQAWVRVRRGDLLAALLTLVRAWVVAGAKPAPQRGADGFSKWLAVCQGILDHAGVAGTIGHAETVQQVEADEDTEWAEFLTAITETFGDKPWLAKDLGNSGEVQEAAPDGLDLYNARSVGKWLHNRRGRWAGGLRVLGAGEVKKTKAWRVERYAG